MSTNRFLSIALLPPIIKALPVTKANDFPPSPVTCATWIIENNHTDVCMESTGKYWIPIYNILEFTCKIVLAHPKYVKAIRGKKADKKDAKWIADIFKHNLVSGSFIPPADIRQLQYLVHYRWKLTTSPLVRKTVPRTASPFPILSWTMCSRCLRQARFCNYSPPFGIIQPANH